MKKSSWKIAAFGVEKDEIDPRFELLPTTPACDNSQAGIASYYRVYTRLSERIYADLLIRFRGRGIPQDEIDKFQAYYATSGLPSLSGASKRYGKGVYEGLYAGWGHSRPPTAMRGMDANHIVSIYPTKNIFDGTNHDECARLFWKRALSHVARIYLFDVRRYVENTNPPIPGVISGNVVRRTRSLWRPLVLAELRAAFPDLWDAPLQQSCLLDPLLTAGKGAWHAQVFKATYDQRHYVADMLRDKLFSLRAAALEGHDWQWQGETHGFKLMARRPKPVARTHYDPYLEDHASEASRLDATEPVQSVEVMTNALTPEERAFLDL